MNNLFINFNKNMQNLLSNISTDNLSVLNSALHKMIKVDNIIEYKNCLIFKNNKQKAKAKIESFPDKTGYECFVNKTYLTDYMNENNDKDQIVIQSISFICEIINLFIEMQINHRIYFVLSFTIYDNRLESIFRFYKERLNEIWIDKDCLEDFQDDAVFCVVINPFKMLGRKILIHKILESLILSKDKRDTSYLDANPAEEEKLPQQ